MSRKTIIYAGGFILPDKNAAANRVVSNGKIFSSLGFNTVFLGTAESNETFSGIRPLPSHKNMFEHSHPKTSAEWLRHMLSVEHIEAVANKYSDVHMIILYNVPMLTLLKAKAVFSKRNIKVCYDCTEWTKDTDGSFLKRTFKAFDEILIRNFADKIADSIIVISKTMAKKYKKCSNLLLLPPLVDINDDIWHQPIEKNSNVFEFCFAGIPDGNKESLDKAVQAFCSINQSNTRFRIIGITADDFKRIYPNCQIPSQSAERIIFMGKLTHDETIKYVLAGDCYIFIRESDRRNNAGFPTKFAEAFTCNVPIITTNVSDVGEYIAKSGKGTLLQSISETEIAKAMLSQIENGIAAQAKQLNQDFNYETFIPNCKRWIEM